MCAAAGGAVILSTRLVYIYTDSAVLTIDAAVTIIAADPLILVGAVTHAAFRDLAHIMTVLSQAAVKALQTVIPRPLILGHIGHILVGTGARYTVGIRSVHMGGKNRTAQAADLSVFILLHAEIHLEMPTLAERTFLTALARQMGRNFLITNSAGDSMCAPINTVGVTMSMVTVFRICRDADAGGQRNEHTERHYNR